MRLSRKEIFTSKVDLKNGVGLELGPLHSPIFTKDEANIFYLDYVSTEDLRKKYQKDVIVGDVKNIVEVDYVLNKGSILNTVKNKKFDYIVASHVIEHVPDLLGWILEMHSILKPNGKILLAIPDKRYTFDINRNTTTTGQVVGNYYNKLKIPSVEQVLDYELERIEVDAGKIWYGDMFGNTTNKTTTRTLKSAIDNSLRKKIYQDCHCTVFTPASFAKILSDLVKLNLWPFVVEEFIETRFGEIEFFVTLKRAPHIKNRSDKIEKSIPHIKDPFYREVEQANKKLLDENHTLVIKVNSLLKELENMKNSKSWKITGPLRKIKSRKK